MHSTSFLLQISIKKYLKCIWYLIDTINIEIDTYLQIGTNIPAKPNGLEKVNLSYKLIKCLSHFENISTWIGGAAGLARKP